MKLPAPTLLAIGCAALLSACATMEGDGPRRAAAPFSQDALPDAVKVPPGNRVALETVGVGRITYECRASGTGFEWVFVGPEASLLGRDGSKVGTYYGPPATWAANDGSRITGTQLAVAPAGAGNIPLQLVRANPATGAGAMGGVTFIQRVATRGGVAPATACDRTRAGSREVVDYRSDYIFWKAG